MSGDALTCEANKAVVRRIYEEGYNRGDVSIYDELYQPNFVHHSKTIHDIEPGPAGEVESMIRFRRAIPDVQFTILDQIAERDLVATRLRIHGNPTGYSTSRPWCCSGLRMGGSPKSGSSSTVARTCARTTLPSRRQRPDQTGQLARSFGWLRRPRQPLPCDGDTTTQTDSRQYAESL
jgi:predicted ester cyclase